MYSEELLRNKEIGQKHIKKRLSISYVCESRKRKTSSLGRAFISYRSEQKLQYGFEG